MQFVRKADAERAIERMQGFPIGGGKIRLSWGRSQCEFPSSLSLCSSAGRLLGGGWDESVTGIKFG